MSDDLDHQTQRSEPPLLELRDVVRTYTQGDSRLDVLSGASMTLHSGEVAALIAPSGAGKSTLLHVAGLLELPDGGEVYLDGRPTVGLSDDARTALRRGHVGFVYQFHHLLPEFSAIENVVMPQLIRGLKPAEARQRAEELLSYLGLGARLSHRPAELSGGEQQRVAIARAVANAPRLLLADEPTGNLDPVTSAYVFKTLTTLARASGLAAIVATHNLELAGTLDRRITLKDGVLVDA